MNTKDRIVIFCLSVFDRLMNALTFEFWSRWEGDRRVNIKMTGKLRG